VRSRCGFAGGHRDADPELDPPLMNSGLRLSGTAPYGDRVPTRPARTGEVGLADDDGACRAQARHCISIAVGRVGELGHAVVVGSRPRRRCPSPQPNPGKRAPARDQFCRHL